MKKTDTVSLDFDLSILSKEELINFILYAHNKNITFNEAVVQILESFIKKEETNSQKLE